MLTHNHFLPHFCVLEPCSGHVTQAKFYECKWSDSLTRYCLDLIFSSFFQIKLFCFHPVQRRKIDQRLIIHKDKTLSEATDMAYKVHQLLYNPIVGVQSRIHISIQMKLSRLYRIMTICGHFFLYSLHIFDSLS